MLLTLALLSATQVAGPQNRPAAPYSLPPLSADSRGPEPVPSLVPPGAPAPVEVSVQLDDAVPLPVPPVMRYTPEGDVVEQPASGDPFFLGFAAGAHHPPVGETVDPRLLTNAKAAYPDGRPTSETYAFVMFSKRMTPERVARLEATGARALGFHPHHTQKVALPATAIAEIEALDFVRWIGVARPWQKVHPRLETALETAASNEALEVWVNVFESDVGAQSTLRTMGGVVSEDPQGVSVTSPDAVVLEGVWTSDGWQQRELEQNGLEVLHFDERVNAFRARMMPQGLDALVGLDFVQFVEWVPPAQLFHDESMAMVNADDARNFYDGGVNSRAVAGFADGGMETSHNDLVQFSVGVDFSGSATGSPFDDDCGHGTHVAGTLLGDGNVDPGQRGAAPGLGWGPGGYFVVARIFSTCAPQFVDVSGLISFMTTSQSSSAVPHVVNNSWGTPGVSSAPWVGTETAPRLYDGAAYTNAQLNVFAAGNEGPDSGTLAMEASAKNVLTVGSVNDRYDAFDDPGKLSDFSSRGPCGDVRAKPNVAAPGDLIVSTDAFDPNGYVGMYGTSMAAPHVTGVVASMIDKDAAYAYLPERVTAQLMATAHRRNNQTITNLNIASFWQYGAGRIDATQAMWNSSEGTSTSWAFSLGAGGSNFADFTVPSGATRLVAVMHYVEPSASAGASAALINDWDLYLDQDPITSSTNSGEWQLHQSYRDNMEIRVLTDPQPGPWRWKIHPESTSSTAYFGVSIFVETGDTEPTLAPVLTVSDDYAQPGETVAIDYSLSTPGASISALTVNFVVGAQFVMTKAASFLMDGTETDLMDNPSSGWSAVLGNVHPFFARSARWEGYWKDEGVKTVSPGTVQDTTPGFPNVSATVTVDGTPPGAATGIGSTSHQLNVWSNDNTLDMNWTSAPDNLSGVEGYGYIMSANGPSGVPQLLTLGAVNNVSALVLGNGSFWFNLAAVDKAGNWGAAASDGPYLIDQVAPSAITGITSSSHTPGVPGCSFLELSWDPATDAHSGIAGYGVAVNGPAPTVVTNSPAHKSFSLNSGTYYVSIRAIDNAGNAGPESVSPTYTLFRPTVYCNWKINSQGCAPSIQYSGFPILGNSNFQVTASNILNNKSGLLFWGRAAASNPFQGGTKCVASPTKRTPVQGSGGNPPPDDCSGTYSFDFTSAYMANEGINPGDRIFAQYWYRDPQAPWTTGLTNAVEFVVCP